MFYELLVTQTNTCNTSLKLYRLPLTFTLPLQLKILIKTNYNQQMHSTLHSTKLTQIFAIINCYFDNC